MGLRFRQTFTLFPGVRINVGRRGLSASIGVPGAMLNVGQKGVRATVGAPGTGVSYSTTLIPFSPPDSPARLPGKTTPAPHPLSIPPQASPPATTPPPQPGDGMTEISSASVDLLTSASLAPLRDMIARARAQRAEIEADLEDARAAERRQQRELARLRGSLFRWFHRRHIAELEATLPTTGAEIARLTSWNENTRIAVDFESGETARRAYAAMVRAFEKLRLCKGKWDITADRATDRVAERTLATRSVNRRPVALDFVTSEIIAFEGQAMRFENVNGSDILLYPGMAVVPREDGAFALVDFRELEITAAARGFHESDAVPADARVIGHTWAKTNKDGSPDRRFKSNYQIPICSYGDITIRSKTGISEEYMVSCADHAVEFANAVKNYQIAMSNVDAPA